MAGYACVDSCEVSRRDLTSSRHAVQVGNLYKLVSNKGKKRDAIAELTDCKIHVPPSEDWDEQLGVTIVIEGRNPKLAEQLITDALK